MKRKYSWISHFFNFIAVILGVYLAFYINEKAKINQEREESIILMNSLVNDLSEDIKSYTEYQIPENIQQQKNIGNLLKILSTDTIEDAISQLSSVFQVENFSPTTSTYSSMKYSGKLTLIDNLALQKKLSNYYEGLVIESVKKGEFQANYFTKELLSWLTSNVDLLSMELLKQDELTILRNKLIIYESLIEQKVNTYTLVVEESKKLKERIESILASK
jgi:hypothetical protein